MIVTLQSKTTAAPSVPLARLCHWPEGRPFALFLSHDVDQIHDRELFRLLADANHIRRRLTSSEPGSMGLAGLRMARSIFQPKPAQKDFETLLAIEGRHGFRSTFFLLHDKYWARQGGRYSLQCCEIQNIGRMILDAGSELGVHGGYYHFNNSALYHESLEAVGSAFGVRPCGIRNHLLRFSYPETWRAQAAAEFAYDATYGLPGELGPRGGWPFPFQTCAANTGEFLNLIELPMTVMDATLFRHLRLGGEAALEKAWQAVAGVIGVGGLVSLLWHNNYFNEPEYWDWQMVYEELLNRLAPLKPWCATGAEINAWWRAKAAVTIRTSSGADGIIKIEIHSPQAIEDLVLEIHSTNKLQIPSSNAWMESNDHGARIHFQRLLAGEVVNLEIAASR